MVFLPPLIILGGLAVLFGVGLFIASKVFFVPVDERVGEIEKCLPGANCGACGFGGCSSLAKALVHGDVDPDACAPGGQEAAHCIAKILGVDIDNKEKRIAIVRCQRRNTKLKYDYQGENTCRAANLLQNGQYACQFACLGFGDCALVCPFDALEMRDNMPYVHEDKCKACGKCVSACPKFVIELKPISKSVHVLCRSFDTGRIAAKACKSACIACAKCEKICPFDAIHVNDNLAIIDFDKCTSCGKCAGECPTGAIVDFRQKRRGTC